MAFLWKKRCGKTIKEEVRHSGKERKTCDICIAKKKKE
jgi:hypothetical protein|tara:strand:- start:931 stop:1044 length:114 start_codon:yes stop_codon:yes gene_type:complete